MWNCLGWNIRGINCQSKWDDMRNKISESKYAIVCLQEIKKQHFDSDYLKKFWPSYLSKFEFSPFAGASGGLITIWNGNHFKGELISSNTYAVHYNKSRDTWYSYFVIDCFETILEWHLWKPRFLSCISRYRLNCMTFFENPQELTKSMTISNRHRS
jgi:hypothetical protein